MKTFLRLLPLLMQDFLYSSVLHFFKGMNRKAGKKLALWSMKCETFQHVWFLTEVFKWIVLPASLLYVCSEFYLFRQNVLDSMFLGLVIFIYSTFLPDLPSIYRERRIRRDIGAKTEDLPWHKKYALLLFAPLFITASFMGIRLGWKTTETFHNFKAVTIYAAFLFVLGFFAFGAFPISIGDVAEILSLPTYGIIGYLAHLKVDLCF